MPVAAERATAAADSTVAPSLFWSLVEAPRAISEATALLTADRFLAGLPPGDGHTVMTLPGFMASDRSTRTLRRYLRHWGYEAARWDLGRNLGVRRGGDMEAELDERIASLFKAAGEPVSLVGWSLGGLLAREAARRHPGRVRNVITLGSPLGDPKATTAWRLFELVARRRVTDAAIQARIDRLREPVAGVPTTAIYSRSDAVVSSQIAQLPTGPGVESIRVSASHFGMGYNPVILYAIADRLRQAQNDWQPFHRSGLRSLFYY